mmetsp:Transcript_42998/g.93626  ORF Transcript_42998/g.93626 Transcript_42998/m.93626 type:complete len:638 (-) Transcript_42998:109-2022(-)
MEAVDLGASIGVRHSALGGHGGAPQQLADGSRWVGGKPVAIDADLLRQCTESLDAGKVVDLNLHFRFISQMTGLEACAPHLRCLDLSANNIRQISGLTGANRLRELKLYGCQLTRIQGLEPCSSLAALHLEDNRISAIEGLEHLKNLEYLNLDRNRLQRMGRGLSKLTKLRELHLSKNELSSLDGLVGLSALEVLSASHNEVSEISAEQFRGLGHLDELRLAGNRLRSLSFLAGVSGGAALPSLSTLDVAGNQLSAKELQGLPTMAQLTELSLAENRIAALPAKAVTCWPAVEILDLSGNGLSNLEDISALKPMSALRELLLEGNPVLSQSEELWPSLSLLTSLEYLDDKPILVRSGDLAEGDEVPASSRPGTAGSPSRPGSSRGTGSRPGTSQSLREAGVREPLMHARLKVSEKRFAGVEQVSQWEVQTLNGFAAIEKQIQKTTKQAEEELLGMNRFLSKARRVLQREAELRDSGHPTPVSVAEAPAQTFETERSTSSRAGRRLREAMGICRVEEGSEEEAEEEELALESTEKLLALPTMPYDEEVEELEELEDAEGEDTSLDPPSEPPGEPQGLIPRMAARRAKAKARSASPFGGIPSGAAELRRGVRANSQKSPSASLTSVKAVPGRAPLPRPR